MLLIHPPIVKPGEPPAGMAKLAGALRKHHVHSRILDASIEGFHFLLSLPQAPLDTFSKRAYRHIKENHHHLISWETYRNVDKYKKAVNELNRVLLMAGEKKNIHVSLSNYSDDMRTPVKSADLLFSAEFPEANLFYPYFKHRLTGLLSEEEPEIIGFSLNYLGQALTAFAMIGFLKRICPKAKIVLGGGLVTSWLSRPDWKNPFQGLVDQLINGPGEKSLLEMKGIFSETSSACPDFCSFSLKDYFSPGLILPYSTSSGCYWGRCSFCPETAEENSYLPISEDIVLSELNALSRHASPVLTHFLDNALRPSLMKALIESPPGVSWYGFARISDHLADLDFCMGLKKSGCVMLQLGIESGDQGVLDNLDKGINIEVAEKALSTLKKAGIATYVYLLFGTPAENLSQARHTLSFTVKNANSIDFLNLAIFNLPLFSKEADMLEIDPFYEGDLSLYSDFRHPKGWGRAQVRTFLDRDFKRHKAISPIIRRDPPFFNSSHAPLFKMIQ
ncbi:MAG: radical SAM protein [Proteobacteria bacterium]|nr:radical SAM protein [Pseudomonadota bacterium]